jgi:hypothetical protein
VRRRNANCRVDVARNYEEVWEQVRSVVVPFRPMLDRVPADLWPRIHEEVYAAVGRYVNGQKIEFGASIVLASGNK